MLDCPFSASAAFQQVALFKSPAGGHKWRSGSIIPTVCVDESPSHCPPLTKLSDIGGFRRRKSNRRQNPTQREKRSKQQKLSLRTRSLPQLQDRCWMASSSRKGGTWLSRFYHRQAGVVILRLDSRKPISPFQKKIHCILLWALRSKYAPNQRLTLKLFYSGSFWRTCNLIIVS